MKLKIITGLIFVFTFSAFASEVSRLNKQAVKELTEERAALERADVALTRAEGTLRELKKDLNSDQLMEIPVPEKTWLTIKAACPRLSDFEITNLATTQIDAEHWSKIHHQKTIELAEAVERARHSDARLEDIKLAKQLENEVQQIAADIENRRRILAAAGIPISSEQSSGSPAAAPLSPASLLVASNQPSAPTTSGWLGWLFSRSSQTESKK
jgi:hypothetical protein